MAEETSVHTKEKIFLAAVRLFSERGYDKVSMRCIAAEVGIRAPSIYNHFGSKEELLKSIYHFYTQTQVRFGPDLGTLLHRVESITQPWELLPLLDFHYPPELEAVMDRIIVIAVREINTDPDSERFIRENIFEIPNRYLRPMFGRMIELKIIVPFDIDTFLRLFNYFCFGAATLNVSPLKIGLRNWSACLYLLFQMIKTKNT